MSANLNLLATHLTRATSNLSVLSIKMPSSSLVGALNGETETVTSIGELVSNITNSAQNIAQVARQAQCIGSLLTGDASIMNSLDMLGGMVGAYAAQFADTVVQACQAQINLLVGQVTGSAIQIIKTAIGFITAILSLANAVKNMFENIFDGIKIDKDFWMNREDCEMMFAMIAACMLNKMFGAKLQKVQNEIVGKINKYGGDINSKVSESLRDVDAVSNYLQQETFMLNKATQQINGFGIR